MDLSRLIQEHPIIDYNLLCSWLTDYRRPRDKISELLHNKTLVRVKKGLYIPTNYSGQSLLILANLIYGPSYVSKETALAFYGMIPERVYEFTSMSHGKKKIFDTPVGRFSYQTLALPYYSMGTTRLTLAKNDKRGFLIASKEKALCDLLYFMKFRDPLEFKDYLEGLRIEQGVLDKLNLPLIRQLSESSKRHSLDLLCKSLEAGQ